MRFSLASAALLALACLATVSLGANAPADSSSQAQAEFKALAERMARAKSLSGVATIYGEKSVAVARFAVQSPGCYRFEQEGRLIVCDGRQQWDVQLSPTVGGKAQCTLSFPEYFVGANRYLGTLFRAVSVADADYAGRKCRVLELELSGRPIMMATVYVDVETGLPAGARYYSPLTGSIVVTFSEMKVNPTLPKSLFTWTPPPSTVIVNKSKPSPPPPVKRGVALSEATP